MTIEEMRILLQQSLKPKRYEHSVRVYKTALKMAEHYHADVNKVAVASLIHDCGRQISKEYSVGKAKELGIGLVATALTKGNAKPQNSAFVIGKRGAGIDDLRKKPDEVNVNKQNDFNKK